ncbi:hypothetical protein HanRHA438_Chr15g0713851 [Helianthus annuus]|nr:hypothetical protein HanRHA438_Chr15g0713851 [Helianthus annuus]
MVLRFTNYNQTILIRLFILRYKYFTKTRFLMSINEVIRVISTCKRAMNLTLTQNLCTRQHFFADFVFTYVSGEVALC